MDVWLTMITLRVRNKSTLALMAYAVFVSVAFAAPAQKNAAPSLGTVATAAARLADDKTAAQGIAELTQLSRSKSKTVAYRATAELAAYYRQQGKYSQALLLLKDFQNPAGFEKLHPAVGAEYLRCLLEAAHVLVLQKQIPRALQLLNWAESRPQPYDSALACTKYAEILDEMDEIDRAEVYANKSLDICNKNSQSPADSGAAIGQASSAVNVSSVWAELKNRDELVKARIAQKRQERKFGKDYGLYVFMRSCAAKGLYDQAATAALKIIKEYPKSVFAAAAGYTYGYCLLNDKRTEPDESKRIDRMFDWYRKFIHQDPMGLYRGEAMMLMGRTAMEKLWDPDIAEKCYSQALTYFEKSREKANALSLYAPISGDLTKQTAPTQQLTTYNVWKRIEHNPQDPLKLYNTATAPPWYRDEMEKQCHFALGFIQFSDGKYDDAKKHWEKIASLDPGLRTMDSWMPNVQKRLLAACSFKYMAFTDKEKQAIKNRSLRLKIQYAEYLYVLEHFNESNKFFEEIFTSTNDLETKAVAMCGNGNAIEMLGDKKGSAACYGWILEKEKLAKTPIYANVMRQQAHSLMGTYKGYIKAYPILVKYIDNYKNIGRPEHYREAIHRMIWCLIFEEKYDLALTMHKKYNNGVDDIYVRDLNQTFERIKKTGTFEIERVSK